MSDQKSIYDLKLHESVEPGGSGEILRVPGGWIYHFIGFQTSVFVPYSDEFKPRTSSRRPIPPIRPEPNSPRKVPFS